MFHPYSHYPARAARHWPDHTAVIDGERSVTFAELDGHAESIARNLAAVGCMPGDRVAVLQHNCLEYVLAVVGIARAGGVLVPMLGALTEPEHAFIRADSAARFVVALTEPQLDRARRIAGNQAAVLTVGASTGGGDLLAGDAPDAGQRIVVDRPASSLAQILYTSGTTGRPKGVTHSYASTAAAMNFWAGVLKLTPADRVLGQLPLSHFCGRVMDSAWIGGAALVVLKSAEPGAVIGAIARWSVTHMLTVPTALRSLLDDPAIDEAGLGSLRAVIYAAAPAAPSLVERAIARLGPVLHTGYGQTEAYGLNTFMGPEEHLDAIRNDRARLASVGREYANAQILITDTDGTPCRMGEVGEIRICAPWVTPGFWQRPDLDADRLQDGWLRTGDLGRMTPDGYLHLADRMEDMIISGGYNVYPAEVEHALMSHDAVTECAVFAVPDEKWGEAVYAAVVLRPGCPASAEELIDFAKARLAKFKVPKKVLFRTELPRTAVGKVLRRNLREPYWQMHGRQIHGAE